MKTKVIYALVLCLSGCAIVKAGESNLGPSVDKSQEGDQVYENHINSRVKEIFSTHSFTFSNFNNPEGNACETIAGKMVSEELNLNILIPKIKTENPQHPLFVPINNYCRTYKDYENSNLDFHNFSVWGNKNYRVYEEDFDFDGKKETFYRGENDRSNMLYGSGTYFFLDDDICKLKGRTIARNGLGEDSSGVFLKDVIDEVVLYQNKYYVFQVYDSSLYRNNDVSYNFNMWSVNMVERFQLVCAGIQKIESNSKGEK